VYRYLTTGDVSNDVRLESGDALFVPVHGPRVKLSGEIIRPAVYELRPEETLADLLDLAGGFTPEAIHRRLLVRRVVPAAQRADGGGHDRTVLDVLSEQAHDGAASRFPLMEADEVEVATISNRVRNRIYVTGSVWNSGDVGYTPGMKLSDALRLTGGVHPDVNSVQISRLQSDQTRKELRTDVRDSLGTPVNDLLLQEDDQIVVYSATDFRPDRYVAITGAVRNGGRFPWHEGMTLRDLMHYANGLDDGAYLDHAEIARLPANAAAGSLAITLSVPMDSTYLLERGLDGSYKGPPGLAARAKGAPDVVLQPYDNVLILRQPDWHLQSTVSLTGEVAFPGSYVLTSTNERITDLISRAGGLRKTAYPAGAVFIRRGDNTGRVGLDLVRVLRDSSFRDNFILSPGDSVYIPGFRPVVEVKGAVNSPIAVAYSPGQDLLYYVNAAGGFAFNADKNRAYVQQPNGILEPFKRRVLAPDHIPEPLPGSTVTVPTQDLSAKKDWTQIAGSVAQVLGTTVAIIAILTRR
jgi:polysaccharide export outer membrane protein